MNLGGSTGKVETSRKNVSGAADCGESRKAVTRAVSGRAPIFPLIWRVHARLPERKGQRCRVLIRSRRMNSILVEFADGHKVVTSGWYVRKAK